MRRTSFIRAVSFCSFGLSVSGRPAGVWRSTTLALRMARRDRLRSARRRRLFTLSESSGSMRRQRSRSVGRRQRFVVLGQHQRGARHWSDRPSASRGMTPRPAAVSVHHFALEGAEIAQRRWCLRWWCKPRARARRRAPARGGQHESQPRWRTTARSSQYAMQLPFTPRARPYSRIIGPKARFWAAIAFTDQWMPPWAGRFPVTSRTSSNTPVVIIASATLKT